MRDILPAEMEVREAATAAIVKVYTGYGFRRVETPALETLSLLTSGEGGDNEKLIFKVLKRGEKLSAAQAGGAELADLGLRFDLTVPLARYYAEHHTELPRPLKAIQIGPVWRAERPQRGRFRQFTQCDIDTLGVATDVVDIELILATCEALLGLGLQRPTVRINDRRLLSRLARWCGFDERQETSFFIAFDKLDKIGAAGVLQELRAAGLPEPPIERFATLLPELQGEGMTFDGLRARLGDDAGFAALAAIIPVVQAEARGRFGIRFDPTLVRGMGYYTGPIFEVSYADYPSSIAGGGRYDRMIGKMLGQDVPASGFSIGFERLVSILVERREADATAFASRTALARVALLFDDKTDPLPRVLAAARTLRESGDIVSLEVKRRSVGRQLDELARHGVTGYALFDPARAVPEVKPLRAGGRAGGGMVNLDRER